MQFLLACSLIIFIIGSVGCRNEQASINSRYSPNDADSLGESKNVDVKLGAKESITIDFSKLQFPPVIQKLGVNSVWNQLSDSSLSGLDGAAAAGMVMGSGLLELNETSLYEGKNSCLGPNAMVFRDNQAKLQISGNSNLTTLRNKTRSSGLVNFLQIAGTVTKGNPFTLASVKASKNGNFYPLPATWKERAEYADALARLVDSIYMADRTPSIFSFWQEPSHTLGLQSKTEGGTPSDSDIEANTTDFIDFQFELSKNFRKLNLDVPLAAFQLNSSQGVSSNGVVDGADYAHFLNLLIKKEIAVGEKMPFDFFTIQNYKGERTREIISNARFALLSNRFSNVPILMNEFRSSKEGGNDEILNTSKGLTQYLETLKFVMDQADVSHILPSDVVTQSSKFRINEVLIRLGKLPFNRVPINFGGHSELSGIASFDSEQISAVIWNNGDEPIETSISLASTPLGLKAQSKQIIVQIMGDKGAAEVQSFPDKLTTASASIDGITLKPKAILFLETLDSTRIEPQNPNLLYLRHDSYFRRQDANKSPETTSAYNPRTNELLLGTASASEPVAASVTFMNLNRSGEATKGNFLKIKTSVSTEGAQSIVLQPLLRLDFLNGDKSEKTIFLGKESKELNWADASLPNWLPAIIKEALAMGTAAAAGEFEINLSTFAPSTWANNSIPYTGRLQLSAILKSAGGPSFAKIHLEVK